MNVLASLVLLHVALWLLRLFIVSAVIVSAFYVYAVLTECSRDERFAQRVGAGGAYRVGKKR